MSSTAILTLVVTVCLFHLCVTQCPSTQVCVRLRQCPNATPGANLCRIGSGNARGVCCSNNRSSIAPMIGGGRPAVSALSFTDSCGIVHTKSDFVPITGLIIGGQDALIGAWPWMTSIIRKTGPKNGHICGGSLINQQFVLTAAHCFDASRDPHNYVIRISGFDLSKETPEDFAVERNIEEIIYHPGFKPSVLSDDIAIVKLDRPLTARDSRPVCLPAGDSSSLEDDKNAVLLGWGATNLGENRITNILQELTVPILDTEGCARTYREKASSNVINSLFPDGINDRTHICAGNVEASKLACQRDGGGPLMKRISPNEKWVLIGIVSAGSTECGKHLPTLYVRVETYVDWIRENTLIK